MAFFWQPEAATANSFKTAKGGEKPQNYFKISNLQK